MKMEKQSSDLANRYQFLDFTRGIAIILMFIYHLSFGLAQLGYFDIQFSTNFFWISFRAVIVFLFLSLVGIGLFLASRKKLNIKNFTKRLLLLLLYFSSITWLSHIVRPEYTVYFGILHLIFICSLLGLLFVRLHYLNLMIGIMVVLFGVSFQSELFNSTLLSWVGFSYTPPISDDFAPLFPWFGLVLIGMFIGQLFFNKNNRHPFLDWKASHWLSQLISWAGRYSIHIYFIHFQLFYVLVYLFQ